ncbi:GGDEF family protein [Vibrio cholerae]|nr:GGDEF family protein [Vibrio cholerae]GHX39037.1 GGDEF family protein [Vibrio cholerae]GHZ36852.1 GGDEF family protein [Vibrio cholerae]GIC04847.1 GGDEF family protein [Vibrio cholerae]SPM18742.1 GGDEF family protein,Probable diguanylate cyclase YcdT,diguanylate cyclase,Response regulator containing a CheY-like receiver domain and a GGDEF domain,diguanylate c yclase (GGDEF) domain,GGDEF domain [Vibrio cholerae]
MMDLSFLEIATVINNIACSAIAALFLYMLRSKLIEHKLDTATWFVLLFLAYGLAYTTSSLRFILPMGFAIFVNNLLYQLGGYCMLFAVLRWYQKPIKSGLYLLMMAHSLLFALLLYLLFRLNPEDIGLRILIASLSLSSVYLISAIVAAKNGQRGRPEQTLFAVVLAVMMVMLYVPLVAYQTLPLLAVFRASTIVVQNLFFFIILGTMLMLFLFEEIEWHRLRSIQDELTGAFNRRHFKEQVQQKWKQSKQKSMVALVDIDHFKQINDSYGHDIGDSVITYVVRHLESLALTECLVARYGGEEFAIFARENDFERVSQALDSVRDAISVGFYVEQQPLKVSVSIGAVIFESSHEYGEVLRQADKALYQAKQQGRNRIMLQEVSAS